MLMTGTRLLALAAALFCYVPARVAAADVAAADVAAADVAAPTAPVAGGDNSNLARLATVPPTTAAQAPPPSPLDCCPEELTTRCPGGPLRWWASADYTFGWISGVSAPQLLTATRVPTGPTTVLAGGKNLNGGFRNGFQLRGGFWLNECGTCGIDAGVFFLGGVADRTRVGDIPGAIVGRPFFNAQTNAPDFEIVSVPGAVSGRAAVDATSTNFWGADAAFRKLVCCDCNGRLDCLVGYRFLSYGDSVRVTEDLSPTVAPFPPGTRIGVVDQFTARNQFHGLLLGAAGEYRLDSWYVQGRGAISFGGTFRRATVSGATSVQVPPAAPVVSPGGLLAVSSNSGTFSESDWVLVPEACVRVGCQITRNLRAYAGYSFLFWPGVWRAADQIDPAVNPLLIPPPQGGVALGQLRPLFADRQSSLWVHAISVGLELRY